MFIEKNIVESIWSFTTKVGQYMKEADVLISYNVVYTWMIAPLLSKRKHIRAVLLLADYTEASSFESYKKRCYAKLQLYSIRHYDVVVGLSANSKRFLKGKQAFIRMEGGISEFVYDFLTKKNYLEIKLY